jgi:hypothetical protein
MVLRKRQVTLAKRIDRHVKQVVAAGGDEEALLLSMAEHMGTFKELMDTSSAAEMDDLCERFPSFYRFGKLLETVAQGIQDGRIRVP